MVNDQDELRIKIDEIKEGGYHLSTCKRTEWVNNMVSDVKGIDFSVSDDLSIQMNVYKDGNNIFANGSIATRVTLHCVRCLADFELPLRVAFNYTLYPLQERQFSPEQEISRNELDVLYYQGSSIDIEPMVREQLLLSVPSYPLCQHECKGMCPRCGVNLNQESCRCVKEEKPISKFEILKKFPVKH